MIEELAREIRDRSRVHDNANMLYPREVFARLVLALRERDRREKGITYREDEGGPPLGQIPEQRTEAANDETRTDPPASDVAAPPAEGTPT